MRRVAHNEIPFFASGDLLEAIGQINGDPVCDAVKIRCPLSCLNSSWIYIGERDMSTKATGQEGVTNVSGPGAELK
jgi:hypothetical protein